MLKSGFKKILTQYFFPKTLSLNYKTFQSFAKARSQYDINFDQENRFFKNFRTTYLLDDLQIFRFFRNPTFFQYMNENFRILPFLFDPKKIIKFRALFDDNKKYQQQILEWFQHSQEERYFLCKDFPKSKALNERRVATLKPFIELYLDFLQTAYPKELEISISLSTKTDLRMPHEWYPQARKMKRKIIYHHGPTNSGKTFSALQDLENTHNGIYCAPLRLLAWEIFERLEGKGIPCNLITGQEKIIREDADHVSCTVETSNFGRYYNVAVIDEIQMIGDSERGSGWTNAFLGLQAPTIHLCGEGRALSLINKLCQITGDVLEERRYERYSKVFVESKPFRIEELQEGDCIITFSRRNVHRIKNLINEINKEFFNSCAVIYGRLPPETRKEQARKFNDPVSNFKYLIATNAIGMGVNLKIRRIIFQGLTRMGADGQIVQIDQNEIKQIAGRAGRYTENGYVNCFKDIDLKIVRKALRGVNSRVRQDVTVQGAVEINMIYNKKTEIDGEEEIEEEEFTIQEKTEIIQKEVEEYDMPEGELEVSNRIFSNEEQDITKADAFSKDLEIFEGKKSPLSVIFRKFVSIAQIEGTYFIQKYEDFCFIADMLERSKLTLQDHYIFASSPLNLNEKWKKAKKSLKEYADNYGKRKYNQVRLPNHFESNNPIFHKKKYTLEDLNVLEEQHHSKFSLVLELYLWLGQKFPQAFLEQERARYLKEYICELIDKALEEAEPIRE